MEKGLQTSAWLWPFHHKLWSLRLRAPISNQDSQQEVYTPSKSLEHLTANKTQIYFLPQQELLLPVPKLRCIESHVDQETGKKYRGPQSLTVSGASWQNYTVSEETTDSNEISDHMKELRWDKKGKGPFSLEVPDMKNTLSSLSAFHPVIRKRPASFFVTT